MRRTRHYAVCLVALLCVSAFAPRSAHAVEFLKRTSTFEQMKRDVEADGWYVIWSESYGIGDAAVLAACVELGCAQAFLSHRLGTLIDKVGVDVVKKCLANHNEIFGAGELEVQAGTAYWSVRIKLFPGATVTTERFVRLYVRYRRKDRGGDPLPPEPVAHWEGKGCACGDVAIGANGSIFTLGHAGDELPGGGFPVTRFQGESLPPLPPREGYGQMGAGKLTVDPTGKPWVVRVDQQLFQFDGTSWQHQEIACGDVAIGANGSIFTLGHAGDELPGGGFPVSRFRGESLPPLPPREGYRQMGAVNLAVDREGKPWVVRADQQLFQFDGTNWHSKGHACGDVAIGANGSIFTLGHAGEECPGLGFVVKKFEGAGLPPLPPREGYEQMGAVNLAVDPTGKPWVVRADQQLFATTTAP